MQVDSATKEMSGTHSSYYHQPQAHPTTSLTTATAYDLKNRSGVNTITEKKRASGHDEADNTMTHQLKTKKTTT